MYTFIHFREYVFGWGFNIVLVLLCFSFTPRVTGHVSVLLEQICGRVFQYSRHIQHLHFVLPSAKHRENEGEKLGQQPSAHCCHTDSLCSNDSGSAPPPTTTHVLVCMFFTLFISLSSPTYLMPPLSTPSGLILLHPSIHTISFALQICALSYFALLCIFFCFLFLTSADVCLRFRSSTVQACYDVFPHQNV